MKNVLHTDDRLEAEAFISSAFLPVNIDLLGRQEHQLELESIRLSGTVVGRIATSRNARVYSRNAAENFHVNVPFRGLVVRRSAESSQPTSKGTASVFAPGQLPDTLWLEQATQTCLMIPKAQIEGILESFLDRPLDRPLSMAPVMRLDRPEALGFRQVLGMIATELSGDGELSRLSVAQHDLERLLIDYLLLGHHHNYSEALQSDDTSHDANVAARARELIESDPSAPWTSISLAAAVHVSVRTLQYSFRRDFGETPVAYLRRVRLRRVRRAILAGLNGKQRLQTIASSWGFHHQGRFAAAYRREFGELPSETLRKRDSS